MDDLLLADDTENGGVAGLFIATPDKVVNRALAHRCQPHQPSPGAT